MKKIIILACFVSCLACSAAWAKVCSQCQTVIPDNANFCLSCGLQFKVVPVKKSSPGSNKDALFNAFAPVDNFEKTIKTGAYSAIVGGFPQFKVTYGNALRRFNGARARLPEELQLIGQLYIEKARACEGIVTALTTMRMDSPYRSGLLLYFGQVLTWYNKALQKARSLPVFTPADVANLKAQAEIITTRAKRHEVTAKFLRVGKINVPRGASIAVLDVRQDKAMVVVLCETASDGPLQRWETLALLRGHTTWAAACEAAFLNSPFSVDN